MVFGSGTSSCATWLATEADEAAGSNWLLGFWSGSNVRNSNGLVGRSTDYLGVIAIAKKDCLEDPAATLVTVAIRTYNRFASEGR